MVERELIGAQQRRDSKNRIFRIILVVIVLSSASILAVHQDPIYADDDYHPAFCVLCNHNSRSPE